MDAIIEALTNIDNPFQRERERRRIQNELSTRTTKVRVAPERVGTSDVVEVKEDGETGTRHLVPFSLSTEDLKNAAKGHTRSKVKQSVIDAYRESLTKSEPKTKAKKRPTKMVGSEDVKVFRTKGQWDKAYKDAFAAAPEGLRRRTAKRAYGLVKFHDMTPAEAVKKAKEDILG